MILSMRSTRRGWMPPALIMMIVASGPAVRAGDLPAGAGKVDPAEEAFFESKVRPVLVEHCLECHGEEKSKGEPAARRPRIDAQGRRRRAGRRAGQARGEHVVEAIRYGGDVQMPPKGKLKDAEIAALTDWVKRGRTGPRPARSRGHPRRVGRDRSTPSAAGKPDPSIASAATEQARSFWAFRPAATPAAPGARRLLADLADRPVHPRPPRGRRPLAVADGRQDGPDPPRHLRPHRPASDPRGGRGLPPR